MIDNRELRIGNWVELKNSGSIKLDADNIGDVLNNPAIFDPIPLTPEILERAGFEKGGEDYFNREVVGNISLFYSEGAISISLSDNDFESITQKLNIKYVHQLQNLFYFLCGEELKINL